MDETVNRSAKMRWNRGFAGVFAVAPVPKAPKQVQPVSLRRSSLPCLAPVGDHVGQVSVFLACMGNLGLYPGQPAFLPFLFPIQDILCDLWNRHIWIFFGCWTNGYLSVDGYFAVWNIMGVWDIFDGVYYVCNPIHLTDSVWQIMWDRRRREGLDVWLN